MAGRKNGLGRGLDAFFPDRTSVVKEPARKTITKTVKTEKKSDVAEKQTNPTVAKKQTADSKTGAMIVKISSVEPNMDQPRKQFDEDALMELSESIKQYGVLHPLLVSDKKVNPAPSSKSAAIFPSVFISPVVGVTTPVISFNKVDFPEPFVPTIPTDSPCFILIFIFFNA